MRPIPQKLRKIISEDSYYKKCCITGDINVSLEHAWIYAGRQINELWAIVPLRRDLNTCPMDSKIKDQVKLIALERATPQDLAKYPKKNWDQELKYLKNKIANYSGNE